MHGIYKYVTLILNTSGRLSREFNNYWLIIMNIW